MQSEQNTTVRTVTTNSFIYRIFANIWAIGMIEKIQAKAAQSVARGVVLCGPQSHKRLVHRSYRAAAPPI